MNLFQKLKLELHFFQQYFTPPTPETRWEWNHPGSHVLYFCRSIRRNNCIYATLGILLFCI